MINFPTPEHIKRMGPDATYVFEERVCIACEGSGLNQPTSEIVIMATRAAMDSLSGSVNKSTVVLPESSPGLLAEGRLF